MPVRPGLIAGAIVALSLVAGVFLYASLPGVISGPPSTTGSSRGSSGSAGTTFSNPGFLMSARGCVASYRSNGTAYAVPCAFGGTVVDALLFNCLAEAALPSGCTVQISGMPNRVQAPPPINGSINISSTVPVLNNTITVWYPYVDQTGKAPSWANCMFQVGHLYPGSQYGFCISVTSTAFVVSGPASVPLGHG
jgi:hypothetical protein